MAFGWVVSFFSFRLMHFWLGVAVSYLVVSCHFIPVLLSGTVSRMTCFTILSLPGDSQRVRFACVPFRTVSGQFVSLQPHLSFGWDSSVSY